MAADVPTIITRAEAKALGLARYFTGKACRNGGIAARRVNGSGCTCEVCAAADRAKTKRYADANPASTRAAQARWRENNPEHQRALGREFTRRHKDRLYARVVRWKDENRSAVSAAERARYQANPGPAKSRAQERRARALSATPVEIGEFDRLVIEEAYAAAERRSAATGIPWEVDHMIPLARGGAHAWHNLQVIPRRVNRAKRDRLIYTEPLQWLDFYCGR